MSIRLDLDLTLLTEGFGIAGLCTGLKKTQNPFLEHPTGINRRWAYIYRVPYYVVYAIPL